MPYALRLDFSPFFLPGPIFLLESLRFRVKANSQNCWPRFLALFKNHLLATPWVDRSDSTLTRSFILLLKYTEHSPNLEKWSRINQLAYLWAYLEWRLQSFRTSLRKLIEEGIPDLIKSGTFDCKPGTSSLTSTFLRCVLSQSNLSLEERQRDYTTLFIRSGYFC